MELQRTRQPVDRGCERMQLGERFVRNEMRELGPGDLLVLPQGWKGEWLIRETTRKLYMIQSAG